MGAAARRLDLALLALALLLAIVLGAQDLHAPWEDGFKGANGGAYTARFVQYHLRLGLGVTHGGSVVGFEPSAGHPPIFYLNHPATYTLVQLVPAAIFGLSEASVRATALVLWLPAIVALWWLGRRVLGAPAAGFCALLLATVPMTAYYGPMAVPDGALLGGFVLVAAAFVRHLQAPSRRSGVVLGAAFVGAVLLDWSSAWLLPLLLLLALAQPDRRRALRVVVRLALLALLPAALLLAHTALLRGDLTQAFKDWSDLGSFSQSERPGRGPLLVVVAHDALHLDGPRLLALAATGVAVALLAPRRLGLRRPLVVACALATPGLLQVLVVPSHAREHEFWSMYATPGLVLAALLPFAAAQRALAAAGPRLWLRAALVVLALACGEVARAGFLATRQLTESQATTFFRDLGEELNAWFGPDDVVGTSIPASRADVYADAMLVGPVETPAQARNLQRSFAPPVFTGKLGFLLPAREKNTPLARVLGEMATPEPVKGGLLYRLRP